MLCKTVAAIVLPLTWIATSVGAQTFIPPADCTATPGAMISSSKFNTCIAAITTALNAPRAALPQSTQAGLPSPGIPGRLYVVTDGIRGPWVDTGTRWRSLTGEANVIDFGADPTGTVDSSAAAQAAIDTAYKAKVSVRWPPGTYRLNTTLNLANKRGIVMLATTGYDDHGVKLLGATGAGKPVIDMAGAHGAILDGFAIEATTSTIGILLGYTTLDDSGGLRLKNLLISLPNTKTANSSTGTIGILNKSAEIVTYENMMVTANLPMVLTSQTGELSWIRGTLASTYTPSSEYATFVPMSGGIHNFVGSNSLRALGHHRPALAVWNGGYINAGALYLTSVDAASDNGSHSVGMQLQGTVGLYVNGGQAENLKTAIEAHFVVGSNISLTTNDTTGTNGPAIALYGGGGGGIQNSIFRINLLGANRKIVDQDGASPLTSFLQNTEFLSDSAVVGNSIPTPRVSSIVRENVRFASLVDSYQSSAVLRNNSYLRAAATDGSSIVNLLGLASDGAVHLNTAPTGNPLWLDTDASNITVSSGALTKYLTIVINGVTYKIPLNVP